MLANTCLRATSTLIGMAVAASAQVAVAGNIIYVDADLNSGADNGSSWQNAYRGEGGLQNALIAAVSGEEIWTAAGTYIPSTTGVRAVAFLLKNDVEVYGGFDGTEAVRDERDFAANETILSGDLLGNDPTITDNSYNVVDANFAIDTAVLDGFTITAGFANHPSNMLDQVGGGMITRNGARPTIRNCRFVGNRVTFGGGAIYFRNSSPTIENCVFENNNGGSFGGAFDMFQNSSAIITNCRFSNNIARRAGAVETFSNCSPIITNCLFENNTATTSSGFGGAMYMANGGLPRLNDCVFIGNSARFGGGTYNTNVSPRFNNCAFINNTLSLASGQGGGMFNTSASPQLRNCLMMENEAGTGGAMYNTNNSNPQIINGTIVANIATTTGGGVVNNSTSPIFTSSVLWGNSGDEITELGAANSTVNFSDVEGGWAGNGANNISTDPEFIDVASDNYRLSLTSPCIDAGDPGLVTIPESELDLDNHARILCGRVDIGAYETGLGDADCDKDVALDDFEALLNCFSGINVPADAGCEMFDSDGDGDVDWADVAAFQLAFTGD